MTQTWALLLDAYRDLNARKTFWVVLILSTLLAAIFGSIGLYDKGLTIFWWHFPVPILNSQNITPAFFYKLMFLNLGIRSWLAWLATILALLSTSSVFPDFLLAGAIDLYLSKPISRLRLFATKYLCGLLFVAMQISGFCIASYLVIGLRAGSWEPGIFLAIPLVLLFYSYLFSVNVLIGIVTRSGTMALLMTLLFWACVGGIHDVKLFQEAQTHRAQVLDVQIAQLQTEIEDTKRSLAATRQSATTNPATQKSAIASSTPSLSSTEPAETPRTNPPRGPDRQRSFLADLLMSGFRRPPRPSLGNQQDRLAQLQRERRNIGDQPGLFSEALNNAAAIMPKTAETIDLLQRELISRANLRDVDAVSPQTTDNSTPYDRSIGIPESGEWILGTSAIFELAILSMAAWIFCRRDY